MNLKFSPDYTAKNVSVKNFVSETIKERSKSKEKAVRQFKYEGPKKKKFIGKIPDKNSVN